MPFVENAIPFGLGFTLTAVGASKPDWRAHVVKVVIGNTSPSDKVAELVVVAPRLEGFKLRVQGSPGPLASRRRGSGRVRPCVDSLVVVSCENVANPAEAAAGD